MPLPKDFDPDVVIVGSGASGSMSAYVLTRAGVKVLMLEAGRHYDPVAETPMFNTPDQAPLRGVSTPDKEFGFFDAEVGGGWSIAGEPFTNAAGTDFRWWRARMLGGRTNHWARHVPRFGPYDFKGYSRDGLGADWPLSYEDLAPYYDRVETVIGVSGANTGLENHPDSSPGVLHDPPRFRVPELLFKAACDDLGIPCVPNRRAVLTRPIDDRQACFWATNCGRGCSIGAAFQATTSLLPMAMATGNLRIVTNAMAYEIRTGADGRATGVAFFDKTDGSDNLARARVVVLAASACESARLLLSSKSAQHPDGLANASGQVGRNLTDTPGASIAGHIPALVDRPRYNEDGNSVGHAYIPWWGYKDQAAGRLDFPRGYHFEIGGGFDMPGVPFGASGFEDGYGPPLKKTVREHWGATVWMAMRGEMIPNADTYCELDPEVKDKFGIPVLRFHWKWSEHEYRQTAHALATARAIIERMGGTVFGETPPPEQAISPGGFIIHEAGTTRMGAEPGSSVVDQFCQAWDVDNLFVVDGGVFASNAHKNLTLTMMAVAWRGMDRLVELMRQGEV